MKRKRDHFKDKAANKRVKFEENDIEIKEKICNLISESINSTIRKADEYLENLELVKDLVEYYQQLSIPVSLPIFYCKYVSYWAANSKNFDEQQIDTFISLIKNNPQPEFLEYPKKNLLNDFIYYCETKSYRLNLIILWKLEEAAIIYLDDLFFNSSSTIIDGFYKSLIDLYLMSETNWEREDFKQLLIFLFKLSEQESSGIKSEKVKTFARGIIEQLLDLHHLDFDLQFNPFAFEG